MSTTETKSDDRSKYPGPVYAAAGAGELAYQKLRKLPGVVAGLRERVAGSDADLKADVARLRKAARRNAEQLAHARQVAAERASAIYSDLVARGEHVVAGGRSPLRVKATIVPVDGDAAGAAAEAEDTTPTAS